MGDCNQFFWVEVVGTSQRGEKMPVHVIPTSEVPPRESRRGTKNVDPVIDYLAEEEKKAARQAKHTRMAKLVTSLQAKAAVAGR